MLNSFIAGAPRFSSLTHSAATAIPTAPTSKPAATLRSQLLDPALVPLDDPEEPEEELLVAEAAAEVPDWVWVSCPSPEFHDPPSPPVDAGRACAAL
jgi:hypothetical protein